MPIYTKLRKATEQTYEEICPSHKRSGLLRSLALPALIALAIVVAGTFWWASKRHADSGLPPPKTGSIQSKSDSSKHHLGQHRTSSKQSHFQPPQVHGQVCVELTGIRLADGKGTVGTPQKMASMQHCVDSCHAKPSCQQAIYSAWNKDCYLFRTATAVVSETSERYNSVLCSKAHLAHRMKAMQQHALKEARGQAVAAVQSAWGAAEHAAWKKVSAMTMPAKMKLLHGAVGGNGYAGFIDWSSDQKLALRMNDGPQGYNAYEKAFFGKATQFPALLTVAASFSPQTSQMYAAAVADEFVAKGSNVILGPDVEVLRCPLSGRSFESLSGEDPFLGSQLVGPFVKEFQSRGVISTVKHWLDNNQEIGRQALNVQVSDRAQHEIYMPTFKAAFEAGAGAVMCAYNVVYGQHACQNSKLLTKFLREELGFRGFVVSDWGATHAGLESAAAGLNVEMPSAKWFKALPDLVKDGKLPQKTLDQSAVRVMASMIAAGQLGGRFPKWGALDKKATSAYHKFVARQAIEDGAVLLKNNASALPLKTARRKIALIGGACKHEVDPKYKQGSMFSGGGSGYVATTTVVTPLRAIRKHVKDAEWLRWSEGASAGEGADVAVVCVAGHSEEGWDRQSLELPQAEELVKALRQQPGTKQIVVLAIVPGAVTTPWVKHADAVLVLFMPGEQVGPAVARLLTGDASPGGRLPVSFPEVGEKRFTSLQYPGVSKKGAVMYSPAWQAHLREDFAEGVLVGYRWNDAKKVPSAFPFGFGLTYTAFKLFDVRLEGDCQLEEATVSLRIANLGARDGAAVPQLYVGFPSLRPVVRQLRGIRKVQVARGGVADVVFLLGREDWSSYDEAAQKWASAVRKGERVEVSVGTSSTDMHWSGSLNCERASVHM